MKRTYDTDQPPGNWNAWYEFLKPNLDNPTVKKHTRGWPTGQAHHNARLTDREVEMLLELRADGWTYAALAQVFEVSKSAVADICKGRRRARLAGRCA